MNLLADESIDAAIVAELRSDGHKVLYVTEMSPSITDEAVLEVANRERLLLMTGDKDFGELVFRLRRVSHGVILIRLAGLSASLKTRIVSETIRKHGTEMPHAFTVISAGLVRIRQDLA